MEPQEHQRVLPTVGRIVHFYTTNTTKHFNGVGAGPYVAVITQVFPAFKFYNLKVFPPFDEPYDFGSVMEYADAKIDANSAEPDVYWVWPPRA
jgi:hypothetical protein